MLTSVLVGRDTGRLVDELQAALYRSGMLMPIERAISAAGSQSILAERMTAAGRKTSQQNISWWINRSNGRVPADAAIVIERITGVSRGELRPDLFGEAQRAAA